MSHIQDMDGEGRQQSVVPPAAGLWMMTLDHTSYEDLECGHRTWGLGREKFAGIVVIYISTLRGGTLSQHGAVLHPSVSSKNRLQS